MIKNSALFTLFFKENCVKLLFGAIFLFAFISCQKESTNHLFKEKTIILYIVGDNNLYLYADRLLDSLQALHGYINSNVIVYIDELKTPVLYELGDGLKIIKSFNETNSLSPSTIHSVLSLIDEKYPSKEKGLILWSHGSGWINAETSNTRAFGLDSGETINLPALSMALPTHYNYIIFDACYMNSIETLAEMKDNADYIVGATCIVPSNGIIDYSSIVCLLDSNSIQERLRSICDLFMLKHNGSKDNISISICETYGIQKLMDALKSIHRFEINDNIILQIPSYDYNSHRIFFDAKVSFEKLGLHKSIIDNIVVYHTNGEQNTIKDSGITIFLPTEFNRTYYNSYSGLSWNKETGWLSKFAIPE